MLLFRATIIDTHPEQLTSLLKLGTTSIDRRLNVKHFRLSLFSMEVEIRRSNGA